MHAGTDQRAIHHKGGVAGSDPREEGFEKETEGLHAGAAQSGRPREATCERLWWSNAWEGKKGNLHGRQTLSSHASIPSTSPIYPSGDTTGRPIQGHASPPDDHARIGRPQRKRRIERDASNSRSSRRGREPRDRSRAVGS